jgi:peptide-methionine (S)-S-oxide reductase
VDYDPQQISYAQLLDVYFRADGGLYPSYSRQYRSAVFYRSDAERQTAEAAVKAREQDTGSKLYLSIEPAGTFYRAEDYHHKYYLRNDGRLGPEVERLFPSERAFEDSTLAARLNALEAGYKLSDEQLKELPLDKLSPAARQRVSALEQRATGRVIHCA